MAMYLGAGAVVDVDVPTGEVKRRQARQRRHILALGGRNHAVIVKVHHVPHSLPHVDFKLESARLRGASRGQAGAAGGGCRCTCQSMDDRWPSRPPSMR
jgi:hypothetical protein